MAEASVKKKPGLGGRSVKILMTLRQELDRGVYPPGSQLPTERALCARFKASRPTVFRAVSQLVDEGRVVVRWGAGMFVRTAPQVVARSKTLSVMFPFSDSGEMEAIQSYILEHGHMMCAFSQFRNAWNSRTERLFLERVRDEGHRALLAFCSPIPPHNGDVLDSLALSGVRVIHLEPFSIEPPPQSYILPDYREAGIMGAVELFLAGCEEIHSVTSNFGQPTREDAPYVRLIDQGIAEAVRRHGRPDRPPVRHNVPSAAVRDGVSLPRIAKTVNPRAGFLCHHTETALLVAEALASVHGRKRSKDRVIAFDYAPSVMKPSIPPSVTTILIDRMPLLYRAVDLAIQPEWKEVRELHPPRLVRVGPRSKPR